MQLHGIVYIAEELANALLPGPTRFYGHWEAEQAGGVLEEGPGWDDVEAAVAWGRARAPVVVLRLGEAAPQTFYSAGEKEPAGLPRGIEPWPPH